MAGFQNTLENLNEGTVCVCFFVSVWLFLIAARLDNFLILPYWIIFLPLWIWKFIVIIGWLVGLIVWCKQLRFANNSEHRVYFYNDPAFPFIQAMSVSVFFHLIIACSEILFCVHLSVKSSNLTYLTILSPLLVVGALGVFGFLFVVIDSRSLFLGGSTHRRQPPRSFAGTDQFFIDSRPRHVCSFTLELSIAANLLQLLFLIARLDHWISSTWIVTFIPSFILLAMGFLFCLAGLTVALITYFTAFFLSSTQRRLPVCYYAAHLLIVLLLCSSLILLGLYLDGHLNKRKIIYLFICTPVWISLFLYTFIMSEPGNPWWFGLNRNVSLAIVESFPALQLCANIHLTKNVLFDRIRGSFETVVLNPNSAENVVIPDSSLQQYSYL